MRLDKFFTAAAVCSRKEAAAFIRGGRVTIDGVPAKRPEESVDPETQTVALDGSPIVYR